MNGNTTLKDNGVIYVRVSSEEQVLGTSLDYQERECLKYCENHGIKVVQIFREEGASAKSTERKQFLKAIEYCRVRKKRDGVRAFVVHKCDRFARNVEDHYMVRRKLLDFGTQLHSVTEPIDDSPQGKVFEAMLSAFAEFDNSIRRQRSIDGMSTRINDGISPWKPPIGYVCNHARMKGGKKHEPDEPHPVVFPILQRGLRKFSQGHYTYPSQLRRDLDSWGLASALGKKETSRQTVDRILRKHLPFYAGILHNPFTNQKVKGKHHPMITQEEYGHIVYFLNKRRVQPETKMTFREDFILRKFVHCAECETPLTGSYSKGRNKKYPYYHCRNSSCPSYCKTIPRDRMEAEFEEILSKIAPTRDFWNGFERSVMNVWEGRQKEYQKMLGIHERNIANYKKQVKKLSESHLKGIYSDEEYLNTKEKLENLIVSEGIQRSENSIEEINVSLILKIAERYSKSMLNMWRDLLRGGQREIFAKFVFSEPILYHHKNKSWNHSLSQIFCIYKAYSENDEQNSEKSVLVHLKGHIWNQIMQNLLIFKKTPEYQAWQKDRVVS